MIDFPTTQRVKFSKLRPRVAPPRRDERLRPISGIPAAPPKSLAVGRGRRHNLYVFGNDLYFLFREASAPVRGAAAVGSDDNKGKGLVLLWKGLSNSFTEFVLKSKGFDNYGFVHAGEGINSAGGCAPARLYSGQVAPMGL